MLPLRALYTASLLLGLACSGTALAQPTPPVPAQTYDLRARLLPREHAVEGSARLNFTNTSRAPLSQLVFHLYMNAFRDRESVFMKESQGLLRGVLARGHGSVAVLQLAVNGEDGLPRARFANAQDHTQLLLPLTAPILPQQRAEITIRFRTELPPAFARAGHEGTFHAVTQWFPKLAKLESDGSFRSFPYHALGEFYADFADYTLEVRTPKDFTVGATGQLKQSYTKGGETVSTFHAPQVHDVAFVASTAFSARTERVGPVEVKVLAPPGYEWAVESHLDIVRAGLRHFGQRFFPYPYPTLTVVIPPRGAEGAASMEYPTLFLTMGSWLSNHGLFSVHPSAFVTAHELAHQWFQGLLASDEVRWPALDEGFAEWAALDLMRSLHGEAHSLSVFGPLPRFELERWSAQRTGAAPPAHWPANAYTAGEYGRAVYARVAIALETLRRSHGKLRFDRALKRYAETYAFGHPTPDSFAAALDAEYGPGFAAQVALPLIFDGAASDVSLASARSTRSERGFVTRVQARRTGTVSLPTWLAAYDEAGHELTRVPWPTGAEHLEAELATQVAPARVVIDPDRAILTDARITDNAIALRDPPTVSLGARLSLVLLALLQWVGA